ncbi:MAG TPA: fatty acid desaturase family protein [Xanthobacteraceae bacterium]|nr:fatty acid desaturase family protein [Xanthobacteraceae bacterium]
MSKGLSSTMQAGDEGIAQSDLRVATKEEIRELSKIDSTKFVAAVVFEYAVIAAAIYLSWTWFSWWSYLLAVCLIGPRIHALGALMHEASHYRAFRNRRVNDIVGEIIAFSTTASLSGYRKNHFAHHRNLNTDDDPDYIRNLLTGEFVFPKPLRQILWALVRYGSGLKTWATFTDFHKTDEVKDISRMLMIVRTVASAAIIALSIWFGFWHLILLYWVVPLMTSFQVVRYIRNIAEHVGLDHLPLPERTRTVVAPLFEQWMIAPYGLNYHLEHHLYPGVTCFNLKKLHAVLMTREPFRSRAHITNGYLVGLLRECMISPPHQGIEIPQTQP